jgi:ferrochelatase
MTAGNSSYDAILIVGFGGPERPEEVMPFLENVTRGRGVPRERLIEVAGHYQHFGGASPINDQVRTLIAALKPELRRHGIELPIYWGNRNWHPLLPDTLQAMTEAGVGRALAVVLAAYSSYSSCRQYLEDIARACDAVGPTAPVVDKVRVFFNHPEFIAANAERLRAALDRLDMVDREAAHVAFTAHSIPSSMAAVCDYERQLAETGRLVAEAAGVGAERWRLVYQSRSGRPTDPWLGPDILDHLKRLKDEGIGTVVIDPVGFLSDHLEVLYDLDEEARRLSDRLGLRMVRAGTVGTHPRFVGMIRELIAERLTEPAERRAVGRFGPGIDVCPVDCCPAPIRSSGRVSAIPPDPVPEAPGRAEP